MQPGYVFYDQDEAQSGLPAELEAFLQAGEAPIVFTLGSSAVHDPRGFFEQSAEAARMLNRRAVFLIGQNPPPSAMSSDSIAVPYAPFSELFPRAAVVVHQGGSGTTAQALRAGHPTLIMPCGFDQPDNAARVKRIGAGLTVSRESLQRPNRGQDTAAFTYRSGLCGECREHRRAGFNRKTASAELATPLSAYYAVMSSSTSSQP